MPIRHELEVVVNLIFNSKYKSFIYKLQSVEIFFSNWIWDVILALLLGLYYAWTWDQRGMFRTILICLGIVFTHVKQFCRNIYIKLEIDFSQDWLVLLESPVQCLACC